MRVLLSGGQKLIIVQEMSRPKAVTWKEMVYLVILGGLSILCLSGILHRYYWKPEQRTSLTFFSSILFLYPSCLLGLVRKAASKKNGDWEIVTIVLITNLGLFLLLSQ